MEKQDQTHNVQLSKLHEDLREFGFLQEDILKALKYTDNKQIAAEIIVKLMEEGPGADLSMYVKKQQYPNNNFNNNKIYEKQQYNKPIRPKMLFLVNGSLKMGKGKICAQVGHAVIGAYMQIQEEAKFDQRAASRMNSWEGAGSPKVVVKCQTQQELMEIKKKLEQLKIGINTYLVQDAGHTQIKAGSRTVLAVGPAFSNQIDPITQHLKLA